MTLRRDPIQEAMAMREERRFVDLKIQFVYELKPDEVLLEVGGRWDRLANDGQGDYDDEEPEGAVVIEVHKGQLAGIKWFASWLPVHAERRNNPPEAPTEEQYDSLSIDVDPSEVYSALFAGGRRGGKSWEATALAVAYAVAFPDAIVWLVSRNDKKHEELKRYVALFVNADWIESETAEGWRLCNGSMLYLKSAHNPELLKEGEAHFVLLNEGQGMKHRAYTLARGAIVDRAGLVLVCANPPVETGDQTWVVDFASDSMMNRRASIYLHFNPLDNPHINRHALLAMKAELDERTFEVEVLGMFRGPKDAVAYNWARLYNERKVVDEIDITEKFLRAIEEGDDLKVIVGLDVQRFPHIGGPVYRLFGDLNRDTVLAWIVDEVVLDGGDEVDFCDALRAKGYMPSSTLIVCDASGRYQHSRRRSLDAPPSSWTGRGSFDIIKGEGFTRIVPPDRRMKTNPHVLDRVRAFTSMIATGTGIRRLFADPTKAPRTCHAIREWRTLHGVPHRQQDEAHLGDAASYPIARLFPRRLRDGNTDRVDPVVERVDPPRYGDEDARITPAHRGPSSRRGLRGYDGS